jgi:hypothetical protein
MSSYRRVVLRVLPPRQPDDLLNNDIGEAAGHNDVQNSVSADSDVCITSIPKYHEMEKQHKAIVP